MANVGSGWPRVTPNASIFGMEVCVSMPFCEWVCVCVVVNTMWGAFCLSAHKAGGWAHTYLCAVHVYNSERARHSYSLFCAFCIYACRDITSISSVKQPQLHLDIFKRRARLICIHKHMKPRHIISTIRDTHGADTVSCWARKRQTPDHILLDIKHQVQWFLYVCRHHTHLHTTATAKKSEPEK